MLYGFLSRKEAENPKPLESITNEILQKPYPTAVPAFMSKHFANEFTNKIETTKPYMFTSLVAWPLYWLYRGLEWSHKRQFVKLPVYIQRTYLQAKFLQVAIILTGIAAASMESSRHWNYLTDDSFEAETADDI